MYWKIPTFCFSIPGWSRDWSPKFDLRGQSKAGLIVAGEGTREGLGWSLSELGEGLFAPMPATPSGLSFLQSLPRQDVSAAA